MTTRSKCLPSTGLTVQPESQKKRPAGRKLKSEPFTEAAVLAARAFGGSYPKAAEAAGVATSTAFEIVQRNSDLITQRRQEISNHYTRITEKALGIVEEKLPQASASQAIIIAAVSTDKAAKLSYDPSLKDGNQQPTQGQPTTSTGPTTAEALAILLQSGRLKVELTRTTTTETATITPAKPEEGSQPQG